MEWFRRITWDVDLKFLDGAWFDNELVQAGVIGNLKLKGPSDKLRVDGGGHHRRKNQLPWAAV